MKAVDQLLYKAVDFSMGIDCFTVEIRVLSTGPLNDKAV
jgi:hypothetical protein